MDNIVISYLDEYGVRGGGMGEVLLLIFKKEGQGTLLV